MVNYRKLEDRVFDLVFNFPERIDEMETRSEENCRLLAARIVAVLKDEVRAFEEASKRK